MANDDQALHFRRAAFWWLVWGVIYAAIHWIFGVSAITFSALVAMNYQVFSNTSHDPMVLEKLLSVLSASLVTFFSAKDASARHFKAHRRLRGALAKYDSGVGFPIADVGKAYDDGEAILDHGPVKEKDQPAHGNANKS